MAQEKLLAGHAVRRLRRAQGLTQAAMAEALGISPSYLNLIERNQRPVPATLLVRMAGTYDFDREQYVATDAAGRRSARTAIKLVRAAGLLVTSTDYFASPTSKAAVRAVRIACQAGAVPFVGDIDLRTVTAKPPRC